jgi:PsbN protein
MSESDMALATVLSIIDTSEPGAMIGITVASFVVILTGVTLYLCFGPPSKELADPFEDHED